MTNININNTNPQSDSRSIKAAKTSRDDVSIHSQQVVMNVYKDIVQRNEQLMKTVDLLQLEVRRLEKEHAKSHTELNMMKQVSESASNAKLNEMKAEHAKHLNKVQSSVSFVKCFVDLIIYLAAGAIIWNIANQIVSKW